MIQIKLIYKILLTMDAIDYLELNKAKPEK